MESEKEGLWNKLMMGQNLFPEEDKSKPNFKQFEAEKEKQQQAIQPICPIESKNGKI